jgi:formiminoglutamase
VASNIWVRVYGQTDLKKFTTSRDGEVKVGQAVGLLDSTDQASLNSNLFKAYARGARYAVIMVPEDIGPRANFGRPGAHEAPAAFMNFFTNMQANRFFDFSKVVIVGEVDVSDLMAKSMEGSPVGLRKLVEELDGRVATVVRMIAEASLEPIVIGGGNNNSFPTILAIASAIRDSTAVRDFGLAVANCDPHADFRPMEGRHSGNPFTYAYEQGLLKKYCILGLHESYNSEEMLARLDQTSFRYRTFEDFAIKKTVQYEYCVEQIFEYLRQGEHLVGCELDLDSIQDLPASAKTPFGISIEQGAYYIFSIASRLDTAYLHLSEAAPRWGGEEGARFVGKTLALLVVSYLKAREVFRAKHGDSVGFKHMLIKHTV